MGRVNKSDRVASHFARAQVYLDGNVNVRIRRETLDAFLRGRRFTTVLDIGCGDASITLAQCGAYSDVTLVDGSAAMLEVARRNAADAGLTRVKFIRADVEQWTDARSYDLVVCLGVLAHLRAPYAFLEKLAGLVAPGGMLVVQTTLAGHPYSWVAFLYRLATRIAGRAGYFYTPVTGTRLERTLEGSGLRRIDVFRYIATFFLLDRVLSFDRRYRMRRVLCGEAGEQRRAALGNDAMYLFERMSE